MGTSHEAGGRHATVACNSLRLHVVQAGPEQGPLVLLLHGFPAGWRCWRRQIGALDEFENASRWVQHEESQRVAASIDAHLRAE